MPFVGLTGTMSVLMGLGAAGGQGIALWIFSTVFGLLCIGILVSLAARWRARRVVLAFDTSGFWWVSGLWLGRVTQHPGYQGSPDYEGHARRERERREATRH